MDILRPPIIRIGNRCYRATAYSETEEQETEEISPYREENTRDYDEYEDESCTLDADLEKTDTGYRLSMDIPSALYKFIIVIKGSERCGVLSARSRIDILTTSGREKLPFTHFLSVPMATEDITAGFSEFKASVLQLSDMNKSICEDLFQTPAKLHMTLGTLTLLTDQEIKEAGDALRNIVQQRVRPLLEGAPLLCDVTGLEYMNDDPAAVDVLYLKVRSRDGTDRLQQVADCIVDEFVSRGLMRRQYDHVKLHVTALNTRFRSDDRRPGPGPPAQQQRQTFDARQILAVLGESAIGSVTVSEVHMSQRYSTGEDGYYVPADKASLHYE